jgi:hypothetical protein
MCIPIILEHFTGRIHDVQDEQMQVNLKDSSVRFALVDILLRVALLSRSESDFERMRRPKPCL